MKELKQRFSKWYNRQQNRCGTLWAERFKSVLVEDRPGAVQAVAAYLDLNPVRAGLVKDPKDCRWCGYAEAVAGEVLQRWRGARVTGLCQRDLRRVSRSVRTPSAQRCATDARFTVSRGPGDDAGPASQRSDLREPGAGVRTGRVSSLVLTGRRPRTVGGAELVRGPVERIQPTRQYACDYQRPACSGDGV